MVEDSAEIFDAGVAAYLLNPLKSSYTYEDMAKEYLNGRLLPAREELLGKMHPGRKAWQEGAEGLVSMLPVIWHTRLCACM